MVNYSTLKISDTRIRKIVAENQSTITDKVSSFLSSPKVVGHIEDTIMPLLKDEVNKFIKSHQKKIPEYATANSSLKDDIEHDFPLSKYVDIGEKVLDAGFILSSAVALVTEVLSLGTASEVVIPEEAAKWTARSAIKSFASQYLKKLITGIVKNMVTELASKVTKRMSAKQIASLKKQALNDRIIKQAVSMIPKVRKEAQLIRKAQAEQPPKEEEQSILSKITDPLTYLQKLPAFQSLMDTASKKTTEFLTTGAAKQKVDEVIKTTIAPHIGEFLQQNKQKLPSYAANNKLFIDDFLKSLDKGAITQGVIDSIAKDNTLMTSIASLTRPIFSSASQSKSSSSHIHKKAFVPILAVGLIALLEMGFSWFVRYMVMKFLWWFASNALWPMVKTVLVGIASYYVYQYFTKSFGNFGNPKELQSMLPSFLQFGKQVATYDALEQLADKKNFQDLQKIVKESGKTQYKIPDNVEQELLATKDVKQFKAVLDKHKTELTEKVQETAGSNSGLAGLGLDGIWSKIFGLFGDYNNIFGVVFAALGALLMTKVMF